MPHANPRAQTVDRKDKQASHRALLAVEALLLASLGAVALGAWRRAVERRVGHKAAMRLAAAMLGAGAEVAIRRARQQARRQSMATLAANLRRHGYRVLAADAMAMATTAATRAADAARARKIGQTMASHWRSAASKVAEETTDARRVAKATATAERFRVRMVATTEASRAFNEARDEAYTAIADSVDPRAAEQPWREWDATLDKDTCKVCDRADGSMVPLDEDFNAGTPGKVHPHCRCIEQIVWMPRDFRGKDRS